jgi:uncharacterized protein YndB with AHSA1/START domain
VTTTALGIDAPAEIVFSILVDAEGYPQWLVGAKYIRGVSSAWPAVGSSFQHAVGLGPLTIKDSTTISDKAPPHVLVLLAGIGPLGSARVRFTVTPDGNDGCHLSVDEEPATGALKALWNPLTRPLVAFGLWGRNAVSLQALRALAEERARA